MSLENKVFGSRHTQDYFANLVYPGAYRYSTHTWKRAPNEDQKLAIKFCKLFAERCNKLHKDCHIPFRQATPLAEDKLYSTRADLILVIFTENLSDETREATEILYEKIIKKTKDSPVRCYAVLIGESCAVPEITKYQIHAHFNLENWQNQIDEWYFLLKLMMGSKVDESLLKIWCKPEQSQPSRAITDSYNLKEGGLVIFLNYRFAGNAYRAGSEVDVENYKNLFQNEWGYDFEDIEDLSLEDTRNYFEETNLNKRFKGKKFSCAVVIISSYGELKDKNSYIIQTPTETNELINHARDGLYKAVVKNNSPIVFLISISYEKNNSARFSEMFDADGVLAASEASNVFISLDIDDRGNAGTRYLTAMCNVLSKNPNAYLKKVHSHVKRVFCPNATLQYNTLQKHLCLAEEKFETEERNENKYHYLYYFNVVYPGAYASPAQYVEHDNLAENFYTIFKYRCKKELTQSNCDGPNSNNYKTFEEINESSKFTLVVLTENLPCKNESDLQNFYPQDVLQSLKDAVKNAPEKIVVVLIGEFEIPQFLANMKKVAFQRKNWSAEVDQWIILFNAMQVTPKPDIEIEWKIQNIPEGDEISQSQSDSDQSYKNVQTQRIEAQQNRTRSICMSCYDYSNRGAVIFLNYKFLEPSLVKHIRPGSEADVRKFRDLFQKQWNYHFDDKEGLSKSEIQDYFKPENLKKRFGESVKFSRIVVIVSTHGTMSKKTEHAGKYVLLIPDEQKENIEEYPVEDFIDCAKDGLHTSLIDPGFPKVFLFSTCHGHDLLQSDIVMDCGPTAIEQQPTNHLPIPKTADMFIGYAQTKGSRAYRHPVNGTRYLNWLHDILSKENDKDICTVHTIAQGCVSEEDVDQQYLQQPAFYSTLRRQLFLAPPTPSTQPATST